VHVRDVITLSHSVCESHPFVSFDMGEYFNSARRRRRCKASARSAFWPHSNKPKCSPVCVALRIKYTVGGGGGGWRRARMATIRRPVIPLCLRARVQPFSPYGRCIIVRENTLENDRRALLLSDAVAYARPREQSLQIKSIIVLQSVTLGVRKTEPAL
jgi:hypothetical protein